MNANSPTRQRPPRGRGAKRRIRLPAACTDWSQLDPANLEHPALYINRELSWLEFNQRVLNQALDPAHPLLERVKFLAIVATNLDEFFMVRVATLLKKYRAGIEDVSPDGLNTEQQLAATRARSLRMMAALTACWRDQLRPALANEGVRFLEPTEYTPALSAYLSSYFRAEILPVLTPLAFDPGHPFPYISNLSRNFAVVVRHSGRTKFARVKIPTTLERFVPIPADLSPLAGGHTFAFLEDIVRANLDQLFPGTDLQSAHLFRIIRDTDMVIQEDEADDLLESVDRSLKQLRYGALCLLEVEEAMPRRVLNILVENFEIDDDIVVRTAERMDWDDWHQLTRLHLPHLKDGPFSPRSIWSGYTEIFDDLREEDTLVHHPFDSFSSVEAFIRAAVEDPQVIAIKMTLYRIGANSPLVDMLVTAAEQGKQVAVLVELKARFDERNNMAWAARMEDAGIHVVYGVVSLKTHAKLCLIIRKEQDGIRRYAHVGTGNYNRATAQVYTDIGLFTADAAIVDDISEVFNYLTGYSNRRVYDQLLVAPLSLRQQLRALIDRECEHHQAGRPARLIFKINALADPGAVRKLYVASQCGVPIDLIVRGVCCLRPGVPGISDTITVRSIVGRFLEHSRIYYFENGGASEVYIGSADLMERNLDRRVEVLCPVHQPDLKTHLRDVVLETLLDDTDRARVLQTDGSYLPVATAPDAEPINAHKRLLDVYSQLSSSAL